MNKMAGMHQKHKGKNGGEGHVVGFTHADLNKRANADNNFTIPCIKFERPYKQTKSAIDITHFFHYLDLKRAYV